MKGIITLSVEVDYGTMLDENNQGAVYLFTGAKTIDDMIQIHMDRLSEELVQPLVNKPLIRYNLDGKLIKDIPQEVEVIEAPEPMVEEDVHMLEPYQDIDLLPEVIDIEQEIFSPESSDADLIAKLDEAIDHVSLRYGIPQNIKANPDLIRQLDKLAGFGFSEGMVAEYKGFEIEPEGMEEPFIIVYKTYDGNEIKFYKA